MINFTKNFKWVTLPHFYPISKICNEIYKHCPLFYNMAVNFKVPYGNPCILFKIKFKTFLQFIFFDISFRLRAVTSQSTLEFPFKIICTKDFVKHGNTCIICCFWM